MIRKRKNTIIKDTFSDKIFLSVLYIVLTLCFAVVAYPLIYVLSASFSSPNAVITGKVLLLPVQPTLMGYEAVFKNRQIITGFTNSLMYMVVGTAVNLAMTICAAFPLSRKEFYGRGVFTAVFVFTMYFSGGLIPTYLLIRSLQLLDTFWVMIIPTALSVWNVVICRTFLQTNIPDALFEAAMIDGCAEFRFMLRIVIPLSAPVLAVLALFYGVGHWNAFFNAMIYLRSANRFPLQMVLRSILIQNQFDLNMMSGENFEALLRRQGLIDLLKYSVIVVASVPVLCIYPLVQRYFVSGVMIGALKG